jgi:hypothetical protein
MFHLEGFNDGFDFFHDMRVVVYPPGIASPEKTRGSDLRL